MSRRRSFLTLLTLFILPLLLFHFQNCAPVKPIATGDSSGGGARLVDDFNKAQIQFATPDSEIQDEAQLVDISGLCTRDHNGAQLKWMVSSDQVSGAPLAAGASACASGQFEVRLDQLDQYPCGIDHVLVVEGDWGGSASTHFSRHCQPAASAPVAPPSGSPHGTSCSLEYSPASAAGQQCIQVCYRSSQVVYTQALEINLCSSLAAGLAGP